MGVDVAKPIPLNLRYIDTAGKKLPVFDLRKPSKNKDLGSSGQDFARSGQLFARFVEVCARKSLILGDVESGTHLVRGISTAPIERP